jgi:mono/diheme cytochrome c family protein
MRTSLRVAVGTTGFAFLAVVLGCGKGSTAGTTPTGSNTQPVASTGGSGVQIFAAQNCGKCHATEAGQRKQGPMLAGIGSKPDRTVEWIMAHIKNPQAHNPKSKMDAYDGKISDADLKTLAEYLITLK